MFWSWAAGKYAVRNTEDLGRKKKKKKEKPHTYKKWRSGYVIG